MSTIMKIAALALVLAIAAQPVAAQHPLPASGPAHSTSAAARNCASSSR